MAKLDKYPKVNPVMVKWIDSMGTGGWENHGESRMEITSIGHMVRKTADRVTIVQSKSHYNRNEQLEIPMVAVKSIKKLKE